MAVAVKVSGWPRTASAAAGTPDSVGAWFTSRTQAWTVASVVDTPSVTRTRNPDNRRVHDVTMTADGNRAFASLVDVVRDFDAQLRAGLSDRELATLRRLLQRLVDNAGGARSEPEEAR